LLIKKPQAGSLCYREEVSAMQLYVIRHGEAVDVGSNGVHSDEERPLTEKGRGQCRVVAQALRRAGVQLDELLTSPLVRAKQTAEELVRNWPDLKAQPTESEELEPGRRKRKLLRELLAMGSEAVGIVGHNPDLSELIGWLIGDKELGIDLPKAGVARIDFDGPPNKGTGRLVWLVNPGWCELVAEVPADSM
jgi:phosphohistidine phosphatase